jgi:hypothetical protein
MLSILRPTISSGFRDLILPGAVNLAGLLVVMAIRRYAFTSIGCACAAWSVSSFTSSSGNAVRIGPVIICPVHECSGG